LHLLSRPRRPLRSGEWTPAKAVTFIVTLAATRSVTLAAREAGMSRKSAYGLKARDPAFAAAWAAAAKAGARVSRHGDKVDEVDGLPNRSTPGYTSPSRIDRERGLAGMVAELRASPPLAAGS
jgi:cobalamin biosynthesis protein CbiG